ncbi:hypothetical protein EPIR_1807 [Erwinia piriflorinigrans CFBP 5888]|uniref:Uncharacterized protein n=1 Tax=Erwinia piriflorinigrans CFBP 5888 TaxID=1161919 RepID=V5Z768_9GAMM|nr:hypothetical protein EPIR_1807 [Erwinia piriflorinigrans CFBP 5888]
MKNGKFIVINYEIYVLKMSMPININWLHKEVSGDYAFLSRLF